MAFRSLLLVLFTVTALSIIADAHSKKSKSGTKGTRSHSHKSHSHDSHSDKREPSSSASSASSSPYSFKLPDSPYIDAALRYYAKAKLLVKKNPLPRLAHQLSERLTEALRPLHSMSVEQAAVTASLLTSSVSLVSIILLPFSGVLTTLLLPFAAGALLSDLAYHLLPHLYELSPPPAPIALLLSVALFTVLDAILRRTASAAAFSSTKAAPVNQPQKQQPSRGRRGGHSHSHNSSISLSQSDSSLANDWGKDSEASTAMVAAYINLAADALHNFCDGLSLAAAFSASPAAGIATTIAIILHELPQELADFALLIRAGFATRRAIFANLLCALTALAGTLVALRASALVQGADAYILPFATGALLYLTFSTVIPDVVSDLVAPSTRKIAGKPVQVPVSFFRFLLRLFVASLSAAAGVAIVAVVESVHQH